MAAKLLSSSSSRSLVRNLYSSQVSFSCQGRSQGTQALAPQSLQVQISGARGRKTRVGVVAVAAGFGASTALRTLLLIQPDQEEPLDSPSSIGFSLGPGRLSSPALLMWTWPDWHPGARHQRQPGVFSAMYFRSSSTYLEHAVSHWIFFLLSSAWKLTSRISSW